METSTFIITTDNTGIKYHLWFYNYLAKISGKEIERIIIGEKYCTREKTELEYSEESDLKKQLISIVPECNRVPIERIALTKMALDCGERYSNIYRPLYTSFFSDIHDINPLQDISPDYYVDPAIENLRDYNNYIRQLEIILDELYNIFKVVCPEEGNLKSFGNAIRNVLILSCTEVDSLMKSILIGNGFKKKKSTMEQYWHLRIPMKLSEYTLAFRNITEIGGRSPFGIWTPNDSFKSIIWYKAYNDVKHDRIKNFKEANLKNAINATLGLATMLIATFGYRNDIWKEKIGRIIEVKKEPLWPLKDFFIPPTRESKLLEVKHPYIMSKWIEYKKTIDEKKQNDKYKTY